MPNKVNAKKALRQSKKRAAENLVVKKAYKVAVKTALASTAAEATEKLRLVQQKLAKAAKKGVIKKNTAARKLSRLSKQIKKAVAKK